MLGRNTNKIHFSNNAKLVWQSTTNACLCFGTDEVSSNLTIRAIVNVNDKHIKTKV